jgi:uncharacterized protein YbbC (DUF1343 family)
MIITFMLLFPVVCAFSASTHVKTGLDVLVSEDFKSLSGKRVGVITNPTGVDAQKRSVVSLLAASKTTKLMAVFTPEHGFTGMSEADAIGSDKLKIGDHEIPLYSLYSGGFKGMRPTSKQLENIDALIFDIQDIGARFYTYLATMAMALEECKKANIEFIVLDRPNPIRGDLVEGPILEDASLRLVTPTAYFQVPIRHGLTAGEMATLYNRIVGHSRLTVIKMKGWNRSDWFDQTGLPWVPPSPNMPDLEAASLYPGIAIFEASNIAVGRGTPIPFRWIGAPWIKAEDIVSRIQGTVPGVEFIAQDYTPTKSVFAGQPCHGVKIVVLDRNVMRPLAVFRALALAIRDTNHKDFEWRWDEVKRMVGVEEFRHLWETNALDASVKKIFDQGPVEFEKQRQQVLLY